MSAANPAEARGRKKVDPNEPKGAKLVRIANGRVTKLLNSMDQVGNVGALLVDFCKEANTDPTPLVNQILKPVIEKFNSMQARLKTGEKSKSIFELTIPQ